ncbi:hypothetical protein BATDEDRAFT_85018 [Batrachochytrium dendrobatidis JAM81]|uniref:LSM complex subunit LSM4 n=2 Tax=Batrachochytrium dendrobatidis TaxID=109871 RepID=F4NT03_BATDJ|nr:uncharacterized protein BATDEDRAFT_85018 [Batrachochytrium dendrobatidis JAM81]EGF84290.1 hypothetical protein BATDEDRAFT_85018 [Batrachochytrium dendrobatidis JAM81]KAJ8327038.1 hypothetical protein O5D80_004462 [Batrachochytrium dendrobatidis]KAK5668053.1 hypothetical protein QVD99_005094 [Batrachochytrium dendrobatidis]OAJ37122.1 hypothetical protein BDEG_21187 [Batrachochytrium dendrobatidis JEL423]|eukprot:XP_006676395.1 hypothetical protein BATDEDRAFT_85018 [Batrachochytrium dendrobatidis JAM81]
MLPLSLLNKAQGHPMLIELKNGDTFNGHLVNCDPYMNVNLREVIRTSADGEKFWKIPEIYIRGSTIKYLRVPDEILDLVKEEQSRPRQNDDRRGGYRSGGMGRGDNRGGRGNSRDGKQEGFRGDRSTNAATK